MSLEIVAQHLAAKGRGPDRTLVHMTPGEVKALDALARKHYGKGLTINPETGMPEAGILRSVLPVLAGAGLAMTGIGAPMAAMLVGGGMTLATGSLQKGLMAGLGAFGGAGMGSALAGMGTASAATAAPSAAAQTLSASGAGAAMPAADVVASFGDGAMSGMDMAADGAMGFMGNAETVAPGFADSIGNAASMGAMETVSPGFDAPMSAMDKMRGGIGALGQPGGFNQFVAAQGGGMKAAGNAMMAAMPFMDNSGEQGKMPNKADENKGYIRPYTYDPRTQSYTAHAPIDAKEGRLYAEGGTIDSGHGFSRFFDSAKNVAFAGNQGMGQGSFRMAQPGENVGFTAGGSPAGSYAGSSAFAGSSLPEYNYNPQTQQFTRVQAPPPAAAPAAATGIGALPAETGGWAGQVDQYDGMAEGGLTGLLKGPGDGVSDSIPAQLENGAPAALADGEFVVPARIVSELGNGSTEAGARKLYAMMDRIQAMRGQTTGKGKVAVNSRADGALPA